MKATGIVRRIDDLGRIVIPREVRRSLLIKEGDPVEIYIDGDNVVLKKYSLLQSVNDLADKNLKLITDILGNGLVAITDNETVLATNVTKWTNKRITLKLKSAIENRELQTFSSGEGVTNIIPLVNDDSIDEYQAQLVVPIIFDTEVIGSIVLITYVDISSIHTRVLTAFAKNISDTLHV